MWSSLSLSIRLKKTEIQNYNHFSKETQLLHRISYKTELKHLHALACHLLIEDKHTDTLYTVAAMIFKE